MRTYSSTQRSLLAAAGIPPVHFADDAERELFAHRPAPAYAAAPLPPVVDAFVTAPGEVQLRWSISPSVAPQGFFVEWQEFATPSPDVWHPYAAVPASGATVYTFGLREMPPGQFRFRVGMRTAIARVVSSPVEVRVSARPPGWVTVSGGRPGDGRLLLSVGVGREQTVHLALYDLHRRLAATPAPLRVPPGPTTVLPLTLHGLPSGDYTLVVRGEGWKQTVGFTHVLPSPAP